MSPRSLILLTFLIGFAIAVVFSTLGALRAKEFDLWSELGKAGVQLGVIVVGGAVLTTVLKALETSREERRRRIEGFRRSIFGDLLTAYNGLKDARRALRASGFQSPSGVLSAEQVDELRKQMGSLSKVQLSLERNRHEIVTQPDLLTNAKVLEGGISQLEGYVHELVREWEQTGPSITTGADATELKSLHELQRFLAPALVEGGFKENASTPVQLLLHEIRPA